MGLLLIGPEDEKEIEAALEKARARPIPLMKMQSLFKEGAPPPVVSEEMLRDIADEVAKVRKEYPSQHVRLGTYMVSLSFEQQPSGLVKHMSISAHAAPGTIPSEKLVAFVAGLFKFSGWPPERHHMSWVEEYQPGCHCVNLTEVEPE